MGDRPPPRKQDEHDVEQERAAVRSDLREQFEDEYTRPIHAINQPMQPRKQVRYGPQSKADLRKRQGPIEFVTARKTLFHVFESPEKDPSEDQEQYKVVPNEIAFVRWIL